MKRILVVAALTLAAAVPATVGLVGNASFGESVPVRVPTSAILVDDHGGDDPVRVTPTTSTTTLRATTSTKAPRSTATTARSDDRGTGHDGSSARSPSSSGERGATDSSSASETPDDDLAVTGTSEPGDDKGGASVATTSEPGGDNGRATVSRTANPSRGSSPVAPVGANSAAATAPAPSAGGSGRDDNGGQSTSAGLHGGGDDNAGHS